MFFFCCCVLFVYNGFLCHFSFFWWGSYDEHLCPLSAQCRKVGHFSVSFAANYFYFEVPINTNTCVLCLLLENVRMLTHMVVSFYLVLYFGSVLCGSILYGALFNVLCTGYVSVGYVSGTA